MNQELREKLEMVKKVLMQAEQYDHACRVLMYDQETIQHVFDHP